MRRSGPFSTVRRHWICVSVLCTFALIVSGCQSHPAVNLSSSPNSTARVGVSEIPSQGNESAEAGNTQPVSAPMKPSLQQEVLDPVVIPPNVEAQLGYIPGRAGGGDISGCYAAAPSGENVAPTLYPSADFVDVGSKISICYVGFAPGNVVERVFDPDGQLIRETPFTIDSVQAGRTEAANDFAGLPGMKPGIYHVVAETSERSFDTTFKVTDQLTTFAESDPTIAIYGPGATASSSRDATHLFLFNFAPNDTVDVGFWVRCEPDDRVKNAEGVVNYRQKKLDGIAAYRTHMPLQVDARGNVIAKTGPLMQKLSPKYTYTVNANGTIAVQDSSGASRPRYAGTRLMGELNALLPICPLPPAIAPLPVAAPVQERDMRWVYGASEKDQDVLEFQLVSDVVLIRTIEGVIAIDRNSGAPRWNSDPQRLYTTTLLDDSGVYAISGDLVVDALEPTTGEQRWSTPLLPFSSEKTFFSTIAGFSNGIVYISVSGAVNDADTLYAIDAATGEIRWSTVNNATSLRYSLVAGSDVYALADQQLLAFNGLDGQVRWIIDTTQRSTITTAGATVYIGEERDQQTYILRAIDIASGQERWQYQHNGEFVKHVVTDNHAFLYDQAGHLVALSPVEGVEQWSINSPETGFNPVEIEDIVYVGSKTGPSTGALRALDRATGRERWRFITQGGVNTDLAVTADTLYLGSSDGYLYAIDRITGQGLWAFKTRQMIDIIGPVIVVDGTIYFQSSNEGIGDIYAIR